jgi:hypothetical protein
VLVIIWLQTIAAWMFYNARELPWRTVLACLLLIIATVCVCVMRLTKYQKDPLHMRQPKTFEI